MEKKEQDVLKRSLKNMSRRHKRQKEKALTEFWVFAASVFMVVLGGTVVKNYTTKSGNK